MQVQTFALVLIIPNQDTCLHVVARQGRFILTKVLLEHGAEPNAQNNQGNTPLHESMTRDKLKISYLLLDHGANLRIRAHNGKTPLDCSHEHRTAEKLAHYQEEIELWKKDKNNDHWIRAVSTATRLKLEASLLGQHRQIKMQLLEQKHALEASHNVSFAGVHARVSDLEGRVASMEQRERESQEQMHKEKEHARGKKHVRFSIDPDETSDNSSSISTIGGRAPLKKRHKDNRWQERVSSLEGLAEEQQAQIESLRAMIVNIQGSASESVDPTYTHMGTSTTVTTPQDPKDASTCDSSNKSSDDDDITAMVMAMPSRFDHEASFSSASTMDEHSTSFTSTTSGTNSISRSSGSDEEDVVVPDAPNQQRQ